jgi:D-alanine-D-alanine ligase
MTIRIGFAYNEKPTEDGEPPSSSATGAGDLFAEWDAPETIDAVAAALARAGQVIRLEADASFPSRLSETRPDIVFNIAEGLRGPNREAHVPAICEFFGIPYTGSDPLALCLGLDKQRAKEAFRARGVPTPDFRVVAHGNGGEGTSRQNGARDPSTGLRLPLIVKPLFEGSSKGIPESALCRTPAQAASRIAEIARDYHQPALVEEFLPGREFTCGVLGNGTDARVLPPVEIRFDALPAGAAPIYGYEAKWLWDTEAEPLPIFDCPADVDAALGRALADVALGAFHAIGCRDWARVDLRLDADGRPQVIEINPLPGVLPRPEQNSCLPKAARAAGLSYDELILTVLDHGLARYGLRR